MALERWKKPVNITTILQEERDNVVNKFIHSNSKGNLVTYLAGVDDLISAITERMRREK